MNINLKINFKIKYQYIIKIIYAFLIIAWIVGIYFLVDFLKKNIYEVVTQANINTDLTIKSNVEIIDAMAFSEVLSNTDKKRKKEELDIKNIFSPTNLIIKEKPPEPSEPTTNTTTETIPVETTPITNITIP